MTEYDFFISYKWNLYAKQAQELRDIAEKRGFTAWLDVDHPFQAADHGSDVALARHLNKAMDACRFVLFFETTATVAMQVGGPAVRVLSWQERELGMARANRLITLYHGGMPRSMGFGTSPNLHEYRELSDAFTMIETAIKDDSRHLW